QRRHRAERHRRGGKLADPSLGPWFNYATPYWCVFGLLLITLLWTALVFRETYGARAGAAIDYRAALTNLLRVFSDRRLRLLYGVNFLLHLAIFGFFRTALPLAVCLPACATMISVAVGADEQGRAMGNNQSLQVGAEALSGLLGGVLAAVVVKLRSSIPRLRIRAARSRGRATRSGGRARCRRPGTARAPRGL